MRRRIAVRSIADLDESGRFSPAGIDSGGRRPGRLPAYAEPVDWYPKVLRQAVALGPRAVSAVSVATCLVLTVLAVKTPWSPLPAPVIAVAGLAGSAAVWFRGRWPTWVAVIGAAANALSANPGPLVISLFAGTRSGSGLRALALALIGVAGFLAPEWIDLGRFDLNALISAVALTIVVLAAGGYAETRRELTNSLRDRAERAEAEQVLRQEQARIAERVRIAREMHDVLAHKVALISLHAGGLEVNPRAEPARIEQGAAMIRATAQEAVEELRTILGVLRASPGDDSFQELPDLRQLADTWTRAGVKVSLRDDLGTLPEPLARAAYRLVQEGLTNAHKYAPGAAVTVEIVGGDEVMVAVRNEPSRPQGPRPAPSGSGSGVGLAGLEERFRLVGGTVHSGPDDAGGWRLEGRLPWV
jgi:signal transduction histidine kinase